MKNKTLFLFSSIILISLFSCKAVQPILVLRPFDMFWIPLIYIIICWVFAKVLVEKNEFFWNWFLLNLIFTPLLGLIIMLKRMSKK
jgi:hypothetical protein